MLCFPQISVLPKMLGLDPKHFHPSYNVSAKKFHQSSFLPWPWNYYFPRKILTKVLGEKHKYSEGRNFYLTLFWIPLTENAKKVWALKSEKGCKNKKQTWTSLPVTKGKSWGMSLVTLNLLVTVTVGIILSQEPPLREWVSEVSVACGNEWGLCPSSEHC